MTDEERTAAEARLAQIQEMLKHRTDGRGQPLSGYKNNVAAIKAEIERLTGVLANG